MSHSEVVKPMDAAQHRRSGPGEESDEQTWGKMAEFLDRRAPSIPFPKVRKGSIWEMEDGSNLQLGRDSYFRIKKTGPILKKHMGDNGLVYDGSQCLLREL